jgi:hypothetical protein
MSFSATKRHWQDFKSGVELRKHFQDISDAIRSRTLDIGRPQYATSLAVGVWEAICCGYGEIAAVEMGVAGGNGLLSLCQASTFFRDTMGIDIQVYGFDNAAGLPAPVDYRDHPELWHEGQFVLRDPAALREKLPSFAELIIGDIAETVVAFEETLRRRKLAFVAIDVDFYSSAKACFGMLEWAPECYLPVVPFYFDDMEESFVFNNWCGEELAINEFNDAHRWRKFQRYTRFRIRHFFGLHVLDHKIRSGAEKPRHPVHISPI